MTSAAISITTPADDEVTDLVEELAEELENFAFERERILVKLDIRAAGLARRIAREMRVVLRGLPLATGESSREAVMATMGGLLEEAHRLLEGEASPVAEAEESQATSGERLIEEIQQGRAASLRPTVGSLPCVHIEEGEEPSWEDETIARRVVWARSGNRILGG